MRRCALLLAVVALLAGAACTGSSPAATNTPTPSRSPDPNFDSGQKVFITNTGFRPRWLVSIWKLPVVWVNQTDSVQTVIFDHQLVRSGPIPPGGTFSWTSDHVVSVTYHAGTMKARGAIQVSQPAT